MSTPSPAAKIQANLQDLFQASLAPGDAYIRFKLNADITALLSMKQVQSSIIVDLENVTPMPGLPEFVLGMMSSRDRVFCIFDLARLLDIPAPVISTRHYQVIVLQTDTEPKINLGLAVTELQGILRRSSEQIQPLPLDTFNHNFSSYCEGAIVEQEIIPILEFDRILQTLTEHD